MITFDNMGAASDIGAGLVDGPRPDAPEATVGYPWLLDTLDRLGLRATFFVEGWNAVHHPDRVRELVSRGHEVGLHGWVHEKWDQLDDGEQVAILERGTDALRALGATCTAFRAPGGRSTEVTRAALRRLGYSADASDFPATPPSIDEHGMLRLSFDWKMVDGFFHLGRHAGDPDASAILEREWHARLDRCAAEGSTLVLIAHAFISGVEPDRRTALERFLAAFVERDDLEPVNVAQLHSSLTA